MESLSARLGISCHYVASDSTTIERAVQLVFNVRLNATATEQLRFPKSARHYDVVMWVGGWVRSRTVGSLDLQGSY